MSEPEAPKRVKTCAECGAIFDPGEHIEDELCPDCMIKHVQPDAIDEAKEFEDEFDYDPDYDLDDEDEVESEENEFDLDEFDLDLDGDDDDLDVDDDLDQDD